jgi:lysyl-tRNA synthetase class 2
MIIQLAKLPTLGLRKMTLVLLSVLSFTLAGMELGNAFSELLDAEKQQAKFEEDLALRDELGKTPYGMDYNYIEALKAGVPATGGIAVGVDRLVMLLADTTEMKDVTFFPAVEVFEME